MTSEVRKAVLPARDRPVTARRSWRSRPRSIRLVNSRAKGWRISEDSLRSKLSR
ncbi:hypothetical protein Q427_12330 [Halomonas sp. BC04]|nr:hypothetical protein Q427_12330 [Halomonas sp. BC04]